MRSLVALIVVFVAAGLAPAQSYKAQGSYQPYGYQQYRQYGYVAPYYNYTPKNYYQPYLILPKQEQETTVTVKFEVYKNDSGKWGFNLKVEGKTVSKSTEWYATKKDAVDVAQKMFGMARQVVVEEVAGNLSRQAGEAAAQNAEEALKRQKLKGLAEKLVEEAMREFENKKK